MRIYLSPSIHARHWRCIAFQYGQNGRSDLICGKIAADGLGSERGPWPGRGLFAAFVRKMCDEVARWSTKKRGFGLFFNYLVWQRGWGQAAVASRQKIALLRWLRKIYFGAPVGPRNPPLSHFCNEHLEYCAHGHVQLGCLGLSGLAIGMENIGWAAPLREPTNRRK